MGGEGSDIRVNSIPVLIRSYLKNTCVELCRVYVALILPSNLFLRNADKYYNCDATLE